MYDFDFLKPATLDAATQAMQTEGAQILAGGQTLLPAMKQRLAAPEVLVSLGALDALRGVRMGADRVLHLGSMTTHAEIAAEAAAHFPALARLAAQIGDPAVRARGTIGGALANNDPSACYPAAVLASGGVIRTTARDIPVDAYFEGLFSTALDEEEIITEISLSVPQRAAYAKFAQPASRFALVGVFVADNGGAVRVAVTGAGGDGVFRWHEAEAALSDRFTQEAVADLDLPEIEMMADLHGSGEYRAHLVRVMTQRAVVGACTATVP
jgi:carbon-monoxide dehydrogenase medium subunit